MKRAAGRISSAIVLAKRTAWRSLGGRAELKLIARHLAAIVAGWVVFISHAPAQQSPAQPTLRYLGYQAVPDTQFEGTRIGGLSGLDYDPVSGTYYAISDERSSNARYYTLQMDLSKFNRAGTGGGVRFTGVYRLRGSDGRPFGERSVDAESIRVDARAARLFWSSEGNPGIGVPPSVREMTLAGDPVRSLPLPAKYVPRAGRGVRGNLAFESLTLSADGGRVIAATENALRQDGPPPSLTSGGTCRVLVWDRNSGRVLSEHAYIVDAVAQAPLLPGAVAMNGLSELLALDERRMLALERSYSVGAGFTVRLYLTSLDRATDLRRMDSLAGATFTPMRKRLLLELGTPHGPPEHSPPAENYEGISFGAPLPNGNRTLVLVSDDNFSGMQRTLFLAFELLDEAGAGAAGGPALPAAHRPGRAGVPSPLTGKPALQ